ncbi:MAG: hypothetical protein CMH85_01545 [Novosphingobium sp.]|nr:hypothetical protein [Novosphingobium sp.]|tara:strand:+ start:667 stop:858 length:192 start_codon:yes stop_codon:yes gene_type:complete
MAIIDEANALRAGPGCGQMPTAVPPTMIFCAGEISGATAFNPASNGEFSFEGAVTTMSFDALR